jgi:hypothetical protein
MALHTNTVSRLLQQTLLELMRSPNLKDFYLADTTALSLQFGHRNSNEIDLYTGEAYSDAVFEKVKSYLVNTFGKGEHHHVESKGNGTSFFLYNLNKDYVKIDIYYGVPFTEEPVVIEQFRFAGLRDIMAQKVEHIRKGGSKSDFWDLHYLIQKHSMETVLAAHRERFPEQHQKNELRKKLTDFQFADDDFDPSCLLKKNWNLIKLDILEELKK